jgi:hypothetical protein
MHFSNAWHADERYAELRGIEEGTDLFQPVRAKSVCFIDDE